MLAGFSIDFHTVSRLAGQLTADSRTDSTNMTVLCTSTACPSSRSKPTTQMQWSQEEKRSHGSSNGSGSSSAGGPSTGISSAGETLSVSSGSSSWSSSSPDPWKAMAIPSGGFGLGLLMKTAGTWAVNTNTSRMKGAGLAWRARWRHEWAQDLYMSAHAATVSCMIFVYLMSFFYFF